jgi:hypothetical protein
MRTGDPYFDWLCNLVGGNSSHRGYSQLLTALHGQVFKAKLPMDSNRGGDGLQLRVDFQSEHGPWGSSTNRGPCSFLEFLIGLSKRMSFLMYGEGNSYTEFYFWKMIWNLGLNKCSDDKWNYVNGDFYVSDAVDRVNNRLYSYDGRGGLFPLVNWECDQRGVEIWYQMQKWLMECSDVGNL